MSSAYDDVDSAVCMDSLIDKIHADKPFLSFELTPPLSADTSAFIAKIKDALAQTTRNQNLDSTNATKSSVDSSATPNGQKITTHKTLREKIDAFVCTDSPLARFKPSSILSSIKLQNALGKPLICTLSMRDRNSIALCGEILAANEFNLRAFLCLTGDPIKLGDCKESKAVFEENSLKLARIIKDLNSGIALNGKPLNAPPRKIYNFAVINSYANNPASLKTKLKRKLLNAEVCAFFTQPIFARESAKFLLEALDSAKREIMEGNIGGNAGENPSENPNKQGEAKSKQMGQDFAQESHFLSQDYIQHAQIIFGFFPVLSFKVALFLRDKLPGVFIPQVWLTKLESASARGKEYEREIGLELSRKVWEDLRTLHPKIHFMSSNHIELLGEFV